ncbi:MAG: hypothetical protein L5655_02500 [Thermosediminibacteraceae bacterium]|nr:hypothetical protein [Thermosediminibacteraceae bacterium]
MKITEKNFDLTGFSLEEALAYLEEKGISVKEVKFTFPVVRKEDYKRAIVLRVEKEINSDGVILLVSYFR